MSSHVVFFVEVIGWFSTSAPLVLLDKNHARRHRQAPGLPGCACFVACLFSPAAAPRGAVRCDDQLELDWLRSVDDINVVLAFVCLLGSRIRARPSPLRRPRGPRKVRPEPSHLQHWAQQAERSDPACGRDALRQAGDRHEPRELVQGERSRKGTSYCCLQHSVCLVEPFFSGG